MLSFKNLMAVPYLWNQWASAHKAEGIKPDRRVFWALLRRYDEDGRFYHAISHLVYGLKIIERLGDKLPNVHIVKLAFFFHDAVYDAKVVEHGQNEEASARLAVEYCLGEGFSAKTTTGVERLILDTANHLQSTARSPLWKVMSDADLAILGTQWETYLQYAANVRMEYAHIPSSEWVVRRIVFLTGMVGKKIYRLADMRGFETQAQTNMLMEISVLQNEPELIVGQR